MITKQRKHPILKGRVILTTLCPSCQNTKDIDVSLGNLTAWKSGVYAQNAFPNMSADDRERLISGFCPECWNKITAEPEPEPKEPKPTKGKV